MIRARLDCDVRRIRAVEPYPDGDEQTVHDTILRSSPIWNVRAPMVMTTFAERYDFTARPCARSRRTP